MPVPPFETTIAEAVWAARYRWVEGGNPVDQTPADTWRRVAAAAAAPETRAASAWTMRFEAMLAAREFLPGGRILAGAGTDRRVTLCNCFVMGGLGDDLSAIFNALREAALTLQAGGGIGYDFSSLRPAGDPAATCGNVASGPVSFMHVWDAMCATVSTTGYRRGAMMATLRADHPDIFAFIDAKADRRSLSHFNCSVLVTDALVDAVERDAGWTLQFGGTVYRQVSARKLWNALMRSAWESSEPGVLFIDRINAENNLAYREHLSATNPCGEAPLPPYGACQLGSFNLPHFVRAPFTPLARFDREAFAARIPTAVRMLDNLLDVSHFPLEQQRHEAQATRRVGIGFMGLGSTLIMLGIRYDSPAARAFAANLARRLRDEAYRASIGLAAERQPFPALDRERYLASPFVQRLPENLRDAIARHGIRNSHLLAVAPTGTISLLADNVSSGIEPVFRRAYRRQLRIGAETRAVPVEDYAQLRWRLSHGAAAVAPDNFLTAADLAPPAHLLMQAAVQPFVDQAISKTINVPADTPFETFESIYREAHRLGLKGATTFRPRRDRPGVLHSANGPHPAGDGAAARRRTRGRA
jgi:ribonucleoside-diphosphate reductase alpha chain